MPESAAVSSAGDAVLDGFSEATRAWFGEVFAAPTRAQAETWRHVSAGEHALVVAPTGSGKTLAAFLWALDRLASSPTPADRGQRCRVLYISPLKALAVDVERNLTAPLAGIARTAARLGRPAPEVSVGVRTGDSTAAERRRIAHHPPDILITTPESLFLLLTSAAREVLASVETVIIDEVHALAGSKRGAHLAVSLERLAELTERDPQRIGLSATVRPHERVARFLGGDRPVTIVAPDPAKTWDLEVVVPLPDMTALEAAPRPDGGAAGADEPAGGSIWPHVTARVLDLVEAHTSTIVFVNSRRVAERLTTRLNELHAERLGLVDGGDPDHDPPAQVMAQSGASHGQGGELPVVARAHHGSVSKEQRSHTEEALKSGALRCVVATSSLELGIDMGAVDLVVQVASPPSVASGLQRVGRAGHQVGAVSRGVVFPQYRGDLVESAVVLERMRAGAIEEVPELTNPLDVLAQQLVAMCAVQAREVESTLALVRRAAPYSDLTVGAFEAVLDMVSGRYPSEDFAELRPRLVWHRDTGMVEGRPGAQRLAVTSGGTIPDRGLFGVHLVADEESTAVRGASRRVGELDEEMVYESRVGDVITLGTTSWRIEDITHDQVRVSPAPGLPGRLPFWKGDAPSRPVELGKALGAFVREVGALRPPQARERLAAAGLDEWAADNLLAYLAEQRAATRVLPSDTTVLVERFRDELGDWQVCVHSPLGSAVLAPWALAIERRARDRYGLEVQATAGNDGIVLRVPDTTDAPPGADLVVLDPDDLRSIVTEEVVDSALFAARFRECAARALLLPRRDPRSRSPLWQQRMRAAQLLAVASRYPEFPIVLETVRECLADVFDLTALVDLHRSIAARATTVVEVETPRPSPYARSLLFGYVGEFIYAGDAPLAERRAAALTLDTGLLAELLGSDQLRQLLDPGVVAQVEADLQALSPDRRRSTTEELYDLVRTGGPYTRDDLAARWDGTADTVDAAIAELSGARRIAEVRIAGTTCWATVEDLPRLRDALGIPVPAGVAVPDGSADPLGDLVVRWARTHGPFTAGALAQRYGLGVATVTAVLASMVRAGTVVTAEFIEAPDGHQSGQQYCHARVLSMIKRRTLAALRAEVEPTEPAALARFLPRWQQVAAAGDLPVGHGADGVLGVVEQLAGVALPVSMWESFVLPARVRDYRAGWLDELITAGEVTWVGAGVLGSAAPAGGPGGRAASDADALVRLLPHGVAPPPVDPSAPALSERAAWLDDRLGVGGGWFLDDLVDDPADLCDTIEALWELVWAGRATCDTFAPVRARVIGTRTAPRRVGRTRTVRVGARRARAATAPPRAASVVGRWSQVRPGTLSTTERVADEILGVLDRYGVVTRGSVVGEDFPGGFSAAYKALSRLEESGTCRRGYFVAGLGAAQFALPGAVDQLRALGDGNGSAPLDGVHVLAACDPANPYGAALPWPPRDGHRPGRHPGAVVVLVGGELVLYLERGSKSLLVFGDHDRVAPAARALADRLRTGPLGTVTVERIDGADAFGHALREVLVASGFAMVPQGLRVRPDR